MFQERERNLFPLSIKSMFFLAWFLGMTPIKLIRTKHKTEIVTEERKLYLIKNCLIAIAIFFCHWIANVNCSKNDRHLEEYVLLGSITLAILCVVGRMMLFSKHRKQLVKIYKLVQKSVDEFSDITNRSFHRLHKIEAIGLSLVLIFYIACYLFPLPSPCRDNLTISTKTFVYGMIGITDYLATVMCINVIFVQKCIFRYLWMESSKPMTMKTLQRIWQQYINVLKLNRAADEVYGFSTISLFTNYYITLLHCCYEIYRILKYHETEGHIYIAIIYTIIRSSSLLSFAEQVSQCKLYFYRLRYQLGNLENEDECNLEEVKMQRVTCYKN